jgi:diaminopimelate epimerase
MPLKFSKYQGTGNDFIIFDNRDGRIDHKNTQWFRHICDRRFGIGADGVMLLENEAGYDFKMVYYNADGNISSMCGNGGRCLVNYALRLGIVKDEYTFVAVDGPHTAYVKMALYTLK